MFCPWVLLVMPENYMLLTVFLRHILGEQHLGAINSKFSDGPFNPECSDGQNQCHY